MNHQLDFIIIGQGLAGSLLAWTLMQQQAKVLVIDNDAVNASQVAAGLINPVTGKRLVKADATEQFLYSAKQCYQLLSNAFKQPFFIECPMLRFISDEKELKYCQTRLQDKSYLKFLGELISLEKQQTAFHAPFGIVSQKQTGYVRTKALLQALQEYFVETQSYLVAQIDYKDIKISQKHISWQEFTAKKIIFCEGYLCQRNPWFKNLPFQAAKGEILTLSSALPLAKTMLNFGRWMLPIGESICRLGSTFDWNTLDNTISQSSKQNLLDSLQTAYPGFKLNSITAHDAGVRPCTLDKQPFIGLHPHYPSLCLFNGFGAKGSLHIPWYALRCSKFLIKHIALPTSADISRYYATHFTG